MSVQSSRNATSGSGQTTSNAWNQLGQLLTCAICLDRYRNPKLLPCQHTFCMEPCMEGLVDYVRHQVKCPECRAEHRIPYQGIQGFPTSVTLMRFLELHCEVTGEVPDPPSAMMVRCGVCTEKSYVGPCAHCEKKVCAECKEAHLDIMKREISRINGQVRRGLNRLQDALSQVCKTSQQLQSNCSNIVVEIEEVYRRLQRELKDREATLKAEVATFMQNELKNAEVLKEGLQVEVANIESNAELVEKHVSEKNDWDDIELMEYKDTFLRTLEFLRNFDPDQADFNRRLKFQIGPEPETTHHSLANLGELIISAPNFPGSCVTSAVGVAGTAAGTAGGMLMRSKSEHRLASSNSTTALNSSSSQAQRHENYLSIMQRAGHGNSDTEGREGRSSPLTRRRTGELADGTSIRRGLADRNRDVDDNDRSTYASRRYGREYGSTTDASRTGYKHGGDDGDYNSYRSRFSARDGSELQRDGSDGDLTSSRSVRFARQHQEGQQQTQEVIGLRERVLETEDATRGPLSGIIRLMDSPRVMERLHQHGQKLKVQQQQAKELQAQTFVHHTPTPAPATRQRTARQISEDDEIAKQKAANKTQAAQSSAAAAAAPVPQAAVPVPAASPPPAAIASPARPSSRRAVKREESTQSTTSNDERSESDSRSSQRRKDELAKKPASRQASRDIPDSSETARPPSRQASIESSSSTSHERSAASNDLSPKEDDAISKKRFFSRPSDVKLPVKPSVPVQASISETVDSDSDSEPEPKPSQPTSNAATVLGHQISLDDIKGVEQPNYFRFRSAASYSRTPSNSSLDLPDGQEARVTSPTRTTSPPFRTKPVTNTEISKPIDRSSSSDSSESSSSESASNVPSGRSTVSNIPSTAPVPASMIDKKDDKRNETRSDAASVPSGRLSSLGSSGRNSSLDKRDDASKPDGNAKPKFVSRFLPRKDDSDSESDSDIDTRLSAARKPKEPEENASPITALLARSANARRDNHTTNSNSNNAVSPRDKLENHYTSATNAATGRSSYGRDQRDDTSSSRRTGVGSGSSYQKDDPSEGRYSALASKYLTRSRPSLCDVDDKDDSKYVSYGSRYLAKSKSSAALSFDKDDLVDDSASSRRSSIVGGGADRYRKDSISRFSAARRSRLGRSKSSHDLNGGEEDDDDDDRDTGYGGGGATYRDRAATATSAASSRFERPSDYLASKSRSQHAVQSREQSPDESAAGSSSLSSWARYLKTKYGNKGKESKPEYQPIGRSRSSHALYSREASSESSEEDTESNKMHDSTRQDSTVSYSPGYGGLNSSRTGGSDNTRSAYQQKRKVMMKIGTRGSEQGRFTWPRGIAVGPDNSIVVADSSNHRVQMFDAQGSFCKEFGTYGNAEGEFDCLAGVAVNRIGQYIISDRYNHRIQIFDPSGHFLRTFGCQGSVDGKLSYPWGIATDSLGFIYVCDKENHRVQVFQSDGTFVGKFGSLGNKAGQLEHPHYIAVSNTNKVVVSDSNNHRIQIFDVNGRVLSTFGSEGTDEGQFKFPRGVAVDDQGYIIVGDSGNNRIQVFLPDGTFLKSFGTWGSGDGEFKGLEGVAVTSSGSILVCDRENHRIQIF